MPTIDWNRELRDQLEFAWEQQFLPRVSGLTDGEYLWEPVADCWSVRPDESGIWRFDLTRPEPKPAPFTTIAWRLIHIADVFGPRASNHFGDGSFDLEARSLPSTADDALAFVREQHDLWIAGVESLGEEGLARPCGPAEGPYQDAPLVTLMLHINREFLHHAAEIQLLRDLYAHTVGKGELAHQAPGEQPNS